MTIVGTGVVITGGVVVGTGVGVVGGEVVGTEVVGGSSTTHTSAKRDKLIATEGSNYWHRLARYLAMNTGHTLHLSHQRPDF